MKNTNTKIERFGIIVIQSLTESDRKTGDELQHDILQYKKYVRAEMFSEIKNVISKKDFFTCMNEIAIYARTHNDLFTLHFETHGGDKGVYLSSGDCITWEEFYNSLIPINEELCNSLLVVMAMCKGGAIVSYIDINKRAPYKAFIGAFRDLSSDEIARGFAKFYNDYYSILDSIKCLESMNQELNPEKKTFWIMTQETLFNMVLDPNRDPNTFQKIVKMATKEVRKDRRLSLREMKRIISKKMLHDKKYKIDYFCFKDIYEKK